VITLEKIEPAPHGGHIATFVDDEWPKRVHFSVDDAGQAQAAAESLLAALADPDLGQRVYFHRSVSDPYWSADRSCDYRNALSHAAPEVLRA
jgi:hypothetical protein